MNVAEFEACMAQPPSDEERSNMARQVKPIRGDQRTYIPPMDQARKVWWMPGYKMDWGYDAFSYNYPSGK